MRVIFAVRTQSFTTVGRYNFRLSCFIRICDDICGSRSRTDCIFELFSVMRRFVYPLNWLRSRQLISSVIPYFRREGVKQTTTAGFPNAHTRVAYQFLFPRQNCHTNSRLFVSILREAQLPHSVLLKVLPAGRDQRLDVRKVFTLCAHPTDRFKALQVTLR